MSLKGGVGEPRLDLNRDSPQSAFPQPRIGTTCCQSPLARSAHERTAVLPCLPPGERPDVEVRVDGGWYPGEVRSWSTSPSGWWANCSWRQELGETQLGTFREGDVRPDTVDRSYGREP